MLQEIFGVNAHIRAVTDGFAAAGYVAIAPSLFDRVTRGVELGYEPAGRGAGPRLCAADSRKSKLLRDMQACINVVKHAGPVAAVGYCWGGSLAYLAACELPVRCGGLLLRHAHRAAAGSQAARAGAIPLRREGQDHPAREPSRRSAPRTRMASSMSTTRTMASTATSAPPTMPPPRKLARERTLAFLAKQHDQRGR